MTRANWMQISPDGTKALSGLHHFVTSGTNLPEPLIHLVFLRVSQINECAYCIDLHSRDLIKAGMTVDKVLLVPVWHEAEYLFSDLERQALAGPVHQEPDGVDLSRLVVLGADDRTADRAGQSRGRVKGPATADAQGCAGDVCLITLTFDLGVEIDVGGGRAEADGSSRSWHRR